MNSKSQQVKDLIAKANAMKNKTSVQPVAVQELKIIPTLEVKEEVAALPPALPSSGLFLDKSEVLTKDSILATLAPDAKKYESLQLTAEETGKVRTFLGRMKTGASAAVPMICRGSACSYKEKCVDEDTEVLMVGNTTKKIKDIKVGDKIYSFNMESSLERDTVTKVKYMGLKPCVTIETKNGNKLTVTVDHKFRIYDSEADKIMWGQLDLVLSDTSRYGILSLEPDAELNSIPCGDLFLDSILTVKEEKGKHVYDIQVQNNSCFIADNLAVHNCEFYQMDKIKVGENCLLEENLIEYWTAKYIDEFDIDLNSITELHTISRLVEITVKEMRLNMYLAIKEQDLLQDFVTSVDEAGNEIINKGVSSVHTMRENLDARKFKIFESLNATREKKAKLQLGVIQAAGGESAGLASMRNTLETLAKEIRVSKEMKNVN